MARSYLALGSNLGDRQAHLDNSILRLRAQSHLRVTCVSSYFETAPVGGPAGQNPYLNAAAEVETTLEPEHLLQLLLDTEKLAGRVRCVRDAPRELDLDILLYDNLVQHDRDPILPHPRMHERRFVLTPLAEIAPDAVHPVLHKTIRELLAALPPEKEVSVRLYPRREPLTSELAGNRILVTGSTSGIGLAIACELARGGASVLVHGASSAERLQRALTAVRAYGGHADGILADLRLAGDRERLLNEAWAEPGLHGWVNNAGADLLTGAAASWSFEEKWAALVAVDVTATMALSRVVGERMAAQRRGVIINMGWDQAETGIAGDSGQLFGAAKAAIMAFSRSLALTLAPRVRVNCLAPGWIKTAWGEQASETWQDRVRRETPLARWGLPEDVAAAVRWLMSPGAAFITGQTIRVNGGAIR